MEHRGFAGDFKTKTQYLKFRMGDTILRGEAYSSEEYSAMLSELYSYFRNSKQQFTTSDELNEIIDSMQYLSREKLNLYLRVKRAMKNFGKDKVIKDIMRFNEDWNK